MRHFKVSQKKKKKKKSNIKQNSIKKEKRFESYYVVKS